VLWDRESETIVNNESSEIIRMLDSETAAIGGDSHDYYPEALRAEIDQVNELVYENVNNGVYRCGFARSQEAYEEAFDALFDTLDTLDTRLGERRYLCGDHQTEADWRLFTTLVRFDPVYATHFKCNRQWLSSFDNLWGYTRELYQTPGIAATVDFEHIKRHYFYSHESINPRRIVAKGPRVDFDAPHGRGP
jgi:putative glutathione S-transferase